jgi:hypothetical protein
MDISKQNIKSVKNTYEYIEKVYLSFYSLLKIFKNFLDELNNLENDLSFRSMSQQLIDSYNRLILFLHEQLKGILTATFINDNSQETVILKPVYNNNYTHNLELTYFTNDVIATKPLGIITRVSINQINDEILFLRGNRRYTFIILDEFIEININEFKDHIEKYIKMTKEIINWLSTDIKSIKFSIKTMVNVVDEITSISKKKNISNWIEILEKIKNTIEEIDNI